MARTRRSFRVILQPVAPVFRFDPRCTAVPYRRGATTLGASPLHVLVLSPSAPGALLMVRRVQALGHVAEPRDDPGDAAALVHGGGWDALVIDLDGLGTHALEALHALGSADPRTRMWVGVARDPAAADLLSWAAAGVDRVIPLDGAGDAWCLALDARLPRGCDPLPLTRLRELDEGVCRASVAALLDDVPRKLDVLRAAVQRRDRTVAQRTAHSLKGGASQLGVLLVAGLCARLEAELEAESYAVAETTYERVASAWSTAQPWLESEATR